GTLWDIIWTQGGQDLPVEVWPNGKPVDDTPTVTQPRFTGTCTVKDPDGTILGGEASASTTARMTTEVEWLFTEKPTRETIGACSERRQPWQARARVLFRSKGSTKRSAIFKSWALSLTTLRKCSPRLPPRAPM